MRRIRQGHTRWMTFKQRGPDGRVQQVHVLSCTALDVSHQRVYFRVEGDRPNTINAIDHDGWRRLHKTFRRAMRAAVDECGRTDRARAAEYLEAWNAADQAA